MHLSVIADKLYGKHSNLHGLFFFYQRLKAEKNLTWSFFHSTLPQILLRANYTQVCFSCALMATILLLEVLFLPIKDSEDTRNVATYLLWHQLLLRKTCTLKGGVFFSADIQDFCLKIWISATRWQQACIMPRRASGVYLYIWETPGKRRWTKRKTGMRWGDFTGVLNLESS